jgi:hypothetical protein
LASLNLPAALDDVTKQEQCPESIREKSSKVKNSGGINDLISKMNELPSLYKRNEEIINEVTIYKSGTITINDGNFSDFKAVERREGK